MESGFHWKRPGSLLASIESLSANPLVDEDRFAGPVLFVRGGKSGYLRSEHFSLVRRHFPDSRIEVLEEAGHDLHVEDREGFLGLLRPFLKG